MARGTAHLRRRLRASLFIGVGLALTGIALVAYGTNVFKQLELTSFDARFAVRGERPAPSDIVTVNIDADTFGDLNRQWPFPRSMHAKVIRRLVADGARAIVYDVQFTEPTVEAEDNALITAVQDAKRVVLATTEVDSAGRANVFGGYIPPYSSAANANFGVDPGGVIRQVPYQVDGLKTIAVATTEFVKHEKVDKASFGGRPAWIDYAGPPDTVDSQSFSKVLRGRVPPGFFSGKIVVVGASAPSLQDVHPASTTGDELMAGNEIQANAIETVLHGLPLKSVPGWVDVLLIVILGMLPAVIGYATTLRWTLGVAFTAAAAYLAATQLAFQQGKVLNFVYPFGALVLSTVGSLGAHYLFEAFERERVRDRFGRFVPEAVVEQVLARTDEDLRLGGVELYGTSMFTDLRGFTSFSEKLPAVRVIELLNEYLSEMSDAILAHGGTLISFMGDGIFAVYGAPIEQEDHADRALAAGREILAERMPRFNEWMRSQGFGDGFRMGVGLNSGTFMSGNVGSAQRLDYAAIGDTTNTASRLEGMTKGTPYQLFLSDTTKEALTQSVDDLIYVDEFEVRGREEKVKLWSIAAAKDEEAEVASDAA